MNRYLQIHDPLKPKGHVVGIDLGTTNSSVASVVNNKPICIPLEGDTTKLLPSVVHYSANGSVIVGHTALDLSIRHPMDVIRSVKRFMGKSMNDFASKKLNVYRFAPELNGIVRFEVAGGQPVTAIEVSAEILRSLKRRAESYFNTPVAQAVITVPAYFNDAQRQATKDAGRLAGIEVLRLLNEPTAAALAYGLEKGAQGLYAVYDLGGGTFDISILSLVDGVFQVKAVGGNTALGGDDFDAAIIQKVLEAHSHSEPTPQQIALLHIAARQAKEQLTNIHSTTLEFNGQAFAIDRTDFESWIEQLLKQTEIVVRRAFRDAQMTTQDIKGVVLVGGSTRIPRVHRFVSELFGCQALDDINPDEVVAIGAALQADLLTNDTCKNKRLLIDVTPLSLGLETMGGIVERIIPRNSSIPTTQMQTFTTFQNNQTSMDIHVVQGERELVKDCRSLARFRLANIPPMAAGIGRVEVAFTVDADGILSVSAKELSSSVAQQIVVKPSHGLTDEKVEQILLDSIDHAQEDIQSRLLIERQVQAKRLLMEASKLLVEYGDLFTKSERHELDVSLLALKTRASNSDDHKALEDAIQAVDSLARPFVERIMNLTIGRAAIGHHMEDF